MTLLPDSRLALAPNSAPPFLGVSRSVKGRFWRARPFLSRDAQAIAEKNDLPGLLGRVLAARSVILDDVENYLNLTIRRSMPPASVLGGIEKGGGTLGSVSIAV